MLSTRKVLIACSQQIVLEHNVCQDGVISKCGFKIRRNTGTIIEHEAKVSMIQAACIYPEAR